jgi:uncharacterized peroxidase-related enzyme
VQHHGAALRALEGSDEELIRDVARDWRSADVSRELAALLAYAEKLTREPEAMEEADVRALREVGWSDEAILHACEVVAYFNFVNRTADGLGVSLEERWNHPLVPLADRDDD